MSTAVYTFDPGLSTQKDQVRNRIGDSNGVPQWFVADQTINALLGLYSYDETCAQCAESIGALCAQLAVQVEQRNLRVQYQGRSKAMFDLADRIRDKAMPLPTDPVQTGAATQQLSSPVSGCGPVGPGWQRTQAIVPVPVISTSDPAPGIGYGPGYSPDTDGY